MCCPHLGFSHSRVFVLISLTGYGMVYWDKAILGSAALFGMTKDLQLSVKNPLTGLTSTSRLSWATSIFYFGQLAGSYPMTYLLQQCNTRYIIGPAVMVWAIICASTAGVHTWQGLLVQRFFLGPLRNPTSHLSIVILILIMFRRHRVCNSSSVHDHR